jgi:hypothetical protein
MNLDQFTKEKLWLMLVETVHGTVMYPGRKGYTRDTILRERSYISPSELAVRLNMSEGEALVILDELATESGTSG